MDVDTPAITDNDYDALPYPSLPYAYSHPGRLAALATLHGAAPPPIRRARVLELGCAAGGNLLPLAAALPDARFSGFDLSQRQVADGQQRIDALRLRNVELAQADVATLRLPPSSFDYILCHGVFSWVSPPVQDAILKLCRAALAPGGVAVISYNVLPGWHLRSVVRDICLLHAGAGTPRERAMRARQGLAATAEAVADRGPYGALLRAEAARLADMPLAYIMGEFLAPHNTALPFATFAERAATHGLAYLCEGSFAASHAEFFVPNARHAVRMLAGGDAVAGQTQIDILSGRRFRRSLLVRAEDGVPLQAEIPVGRLASLHFIAALEPVTEGSDTFVDRKGRRITLRDGAVATAFRRLAAASPASMSWHELLDVALAAGAGARIEARLGRALLRLLGTGRGSVISEALQVGSDRDARPCVWAPARVEAALGQPWLTTMSHLAVPTPGGVGELIAAMDGCSDRAALRRLAADDVTLAGVLRFLARHALLLHQD